MTSSTSRYAQGMEGVFFSWGDFDIHFSVMTFRDCVLKRDLGRFRLGMLLPKIVIDLVHGEMSLFRDAREGPDAVLQIGFCLLGPA
jgi:hypothetical protein